MSLSTLCRTAFLSSLLIPRWASAADWPRFRGPNGSAVSDDRHTATRWSETENIIWKTPLPGPGTSSPIISEGKIFLTSYTGFGVSEENPGDSAKLERALMCLDEGSGKILWERAVKGVANEDRFQGYLASHGYASSTPATDGQRVYVLFGKAGVVAFDLDGKQLWHKSVGTGSGMMGWGSATSPIVYKNLVIVNAAAESKAIYAFDGQSGKEVWKSPADSLEGCWGTPLLVETADKKTELVQAVGGEMWGFDPDSGKFLWFCETLGGGAICSSLVSRDGIVYLVTGGPGGGRRRRRARRRPRRRNQNARLVEQSQSGLLHHFAGARRRSFVLGQRSGNRALHQQQNRRVGLPAAASRWGATVRLGDGGRRQAVCRDARSWNIRPGGPSRVFRFGAQSARGRGDLQCGPVGQQQSPVPALE
jgi:outer membrane protein assembly factor BamB